ncbi:hypothetical protein GW915_07840 [bacterium]|nr:hypothetical protein [bacterium]
MKKPNARNELSKRRKRFKENAAKLAQKDDASLSFLAAGVAHEFNNLLGAAHGHATWALSSGDPQDMKEALKVIEMVCERSASITKALQNFSQPKEEKFELLNLSDLVHQALKIEEAELKQSEVSVNLDLKPVELEVNSDELLEVFLNLIRNSLDAFSANNSKQRPEIKLQFKLNKKYLAFLYSDNGPGIDPVYGESIFNAFWTSKGVLKNVESGLQGSDTSPQRGSAGLGLFLSRKIIREHGGEIRLLKQKKAGAQFEILLPLTR